MLKPADALLEPDPRFRDFVFRDSTKGDSRPMCMDDLRNMVAKIELTTRIPVAIREQFDIARNAFVYSWFVYEFATLAEQQCYATLEMALRHRLDPGAPANTTRSPGLHGLLKSAVEHGWLRREDFRCRRFRAPVSRCAFSISSRRPETTSCTAMYSCCRRAHRISCASVRM
jgi:hypothetical protein